MYKVIKFYGDYVVTFDDILVATFATKKEAETYVNGITGTKEPNH